MSPSKIVVIIYKKFGLKPNYSNNWRKTKLSDEQKEELVRILENEDYLTKQRVHQIIKDKYDVNYSSRNITRIMGSVK
jgi:putative transposase